MCFTILECVNSGNSNIYARSFVLPRKIIKKSSKTCLLFWTVTITNGFLRVCKSFLCYIWNLCNFTHFVLCCPFPRKENNTLRRGFLTIFSLNSSNTSLQNCMNILKDLNVYICIMYMQITTKKGQLWAMLRFRVRIISVYPHPVRNKNWAESGSNEQYKKLGKAIENRA